MAASFRADIEGLRALAVLPILLFHLNPAWCPGGFAGVDVFFVISGYLITRMILDQGDGFSFAGFYYRRLLRLFPALLVTLAVTLAVAWKILSPEHYRGLGQSALASALAVSNVYFYWIADYFAGSAVEHPLLHTWSLGVEEQFYLLWPALLVSARRAGLRLRLVFAAAAAISFAAVLLFGPSDPDLAFYMMPFRIFEFAGGAILAVSPRVTKIPPALKTALVILAGTLFIVALARFDGNTPWPSVYTLVTVAATMLFIAAGEGNPVLSAPPLRFLGRISYSLYLVHWPVITLYRARIVVEPSIAELLSLGAASVAIATLLHYAVERPFRVRGANASAGFGRLRLAGTGGLFAVASAMSIAVISANGFPHRAQRAQSAGERLTFAGDLCDAKKSRCAFGDANSDQIVYLAGDSHALNLVYGLDKLFRANGLRGIAFFDNGCLFASETTRFINGVRDSECARNIAEALDFLKQDARPVILAGSYSSYMNSIGPADGAAPLRQTEPEYYAWLGEKLRETLLGLSTGARKLFLLKQTYNTGIDVAACSAQPGNSFETCVPRARREAFSVAKRADEMIDGVAKGFPSLRVIDPKTVFCADESCTVRDGEVLYFRDREHLTNAGSAFLISRVADVLLGREAR